MPMCVHQRLPSSQRLALTNDVGEVSRLSAFVR